MEETEEKIKVESKVPIDIDPAIDPLIDPLIDRNIYNAIHSDFLIDWLEKYKDHHPFSSDREQPGYDMKLDFPTYVSEQAGTFGAHLIWEWSNRLTVHSKPPKNPNPKDRKWMDKAPKGSLPYFYLVSDKVKQCRSVKKYHETLEAMRLQFPIIIGGVLHGQVRQVSVRCRLDFLIRSDYLPLLVDEFPLSKDTFLPSRQTYVSVQVRWAKLVLKQKDNELSSTLTHKYYYPIGILQSWILNQHQSLHPTTHAFVIGRRWECRDDSGDSCLDTLGVIHVQEIEGQKHPHHQRLHHALDWHYLLHTQGREWKWPFTQEILTQYPQLRPNMCHHSFGWDKVKKRIALEVKELTLLWHCSLKKRNELLQMGISRFDDTQLTSEHILGTSNDFRSRILGTMIHNIHEPKLHALVSKWMEEILDLKCTIFLDTESTPAIIDTFTCFPEWEDHSCNAMFGVGKEEEGKFIQETLMVENMTPLEEQKCVIKFLDYVAGVKKKWMDAEKHKLLDAKIPITQEDLDTLEKRKVRVWIYSQAEPSALFWSKSSGEARLSSPFDGSMDVWEELENSIQFVDLRQVILDNEIVIPGCWNYGLKSISKALTVMGETTIEWPDCQIDHGLPCAVALLRRMYTDLCVMYNRIDVKAMYQIVKWLQGRIKMQIADQLAPSIL
jgi:hypothetical protein